MLDNFDAAGMAKAAASIKSRHPHVLLEGSGGITEGNIMTFFSPRTLMPLEFVVSEVAESVCPCSCLCRRRHRHSEPGFAFAVGAAHRLFSQDPTRCISVKNCINAICVTRFCRLYNGNSIRARLVRTITYKVFAPKRVAYRRAAGGACVNCLQVVEEEMEHKRFKMLIGRGAADAVPLVVVSL